MRKILLDTSFLVKCAEYKIDFIGEIRRICDFNYELCYIDKTIDELDKLIDSGNRIKHHAKLARAFLSKARKVNTEKKQIVDELIIAYAKAHMDVVVATHDSPMKRILKDLGIPLIVIRQKKYLKYIEA